jgi:hypothetical protein
MADEPKTGAAHQMPPAQFSNLAQVIHTNHEFFLEFAQTTGRVQRQDATRGIIEAQLIARLVMTPQHAKQLLHALQENIARFEKKFGPIEIHGATVPPGEVN